MNLPTDVVYTLRQTGARLVDSYTSEEMPSKGVMALHKLAQQWQPVPGWTQYDVICICAGLVATTEQLERDGAV